MIINFTPQEEAKLKSIEETYDKLLAETEELIEKLRPGDNGPDTDGLRPPRIETFAQPDHYTEEGTPVYNSEDLKAYNDAIKVYNAKFDAIYNAWEKAGGKEWIDARQKWRDLDKKKGEAIRTYIDECELRQFAELGDDLEAIYNDALYQASENLERRYAYNKQQQQREDGSYFSDYSLRAINDGKDFLLDAEKAIEIIHKIIHLHLDALAEDQGKTTKLLAEIKAIVDASPYTSYDEGELAGKIYKQETTEKRGYRRKADAAGVVKNMPGAIIQPTLSGYQYGLSLYQDGNAYLQPLSSTDNLQFRDGKLFFKGRLEEVSAAELQNIKTKEGIEKIDLPLLKSFYSVILTDFENSKKIKPLLEIYVPDLAAYLGMQRNLNAQDLQGLLQKAQSFHNITGVIREMRSGKLRDSYYMVLNFEYYDEKKNTIAISSPYMNYLIKTIYENAIRKDKQGKPKLKADKATPLTVASHSYLVKPSIATERNKAAVENVFILVTLIEQAGNNTPHIKASTIVERNPQLQQRLEASSNARQLLSTCFKKTWELLRKQTYLADYYKNIQLPDAKDPSVIPTPKTLETMVIKIPHDGKRKM